MEINNPEELVVYLTFNCNLSCNHCYTNSCPDADPCVVESKLAIKLIQQLSMTGLKTVVLDGGEPMLVPEVVEQLVNCCKKHDALIVIRTNGCHLGDSDLLSSIRDYNKAYLEISTGFFHANETLLPEIIDKLGELSKRTTLVKYDNRGHGSWSELEKKAYKNHVIFREGKTYHYGRGKKLPIQYESHGMMSLPVCITVGSNLTLCPDGTLWACNGFLVYELYNKKKYNSPLYLGNLTFESAEKCVNRLQTRRYIQIIKKVGHYGLVELLNIQNNKEFEHICEACQFVMGLDNIMNNLDQNDELTRQMGRVEKAWKLRQMLYTNH